MILVPYPFPLRPDLTVTLELPDDLTISEAERLTKFLEALGNDGCVSVDIEGGDRCELTLGHAGAHRCGRVKWTVDGSEQFDGQREGHSDAT